MLEILNLLIISALILLTNAKLKPESKAKPSQLEKSINNLLTSPTVDSIDFNLRLVDVDSSSAQFELVDDNTTTINYVIAYEITSQFYSMDKSSKTPITETTTSRKKLQMQTNSLSLLNRQEELLKNRTDEIETDEPTETTDSGERFNTEETMEVNFYFILRIYAFLLANKKY